VSNPTDILIIADLHLEVTHGQKNQLFIDFCQTQAKQAKQLFILGDLFNTWLGDDVSIKLYQSIIDALKTLSTQTQIFISRGNRDFLLGAEFAKLSGVELINTPYLLTHQKQKYLLTHGDELCTDDLNYQRFKRVIQHPITRFIFLHLSQKLRIRISKKLRNKSIQAQQKKPVSLMDVNHHSVEQLMQTYPETALIHGHTHRQNTHKHPSFIRYVLGDWSASQGNAIKLSAQLTRLEIYHPIS
jgi:UDP-2,3-diacylglucosamine hydrolase